MGIVTDVFSLNKQVQEHGLASMIDDPIEATRENWRTEIAALGGSSPLLHFVDTPTTRIELSTTHPGGLAKFITGARTPLSQLIRDDLALRRARTAAERITAKSLELSIIRGIDAVHLGIGVVRWRHETNDYCAPLLLRSLSIHRRGRDFDLRLSKKTKLNPAFAKSLEKQYGISLDAHSFVALATDNGTFKPNAVIDQLRRLTAHLDDMLIQPRLVVSTFAEVSDALLKDTDQMEHPFLDALAGDATASWQIKESQKAAPLIDADRRDPVSDTLLLDADGEQEHIIAHIARGNSCVVHTLPGTGATQTIVNALGALIIRNKRVLVVSPRSASLTQIAERLADIGLDGVAVSPANLHSNIIRGILRAERCTEPHTADVDDALVRLREILIDYRETLSQPDETLGVSVSDCVSELSRLALLPAPPATTARLGIEATQKLAGSRTPIAQKMIEVARLGAFRYGPDDSPWYGAQFNTGESTVQAHERAKRLHNETLPRLLAEANDLIGKTRMRPFTTLAELGIYLRLLADLRDTLDRFEPGVFDRSLTELVLATSSRRDSPNMSSTNRRRLRKLAKEYVRPGMHVGDLHAALTAISQQRILWQRYVTPGVLPAVPTGIAPVQLAWSEVTKDLAELDIPLGNTDPEERLAAMPVHKLEVLLSKLAEESELLENLHERGVLMQQLQANELDALLADLADRHVPEESVEAELELCWWRSALDALLAGDRALLGQTSVLQRLEADFRLADAAHVHANAGNLGFQIAENWRIGIVDHPDEAAQLKKLLTDKKITSALLHALAPHLAPTITPVWLSSPYEINQLGEVNFDTVIVVDAGATTVAENLGALRRAKQIVAFGDPVTESPSPFYTGLTENNEVLLKQHSPSVFDQLAQLLPSFVLTRSYRAGGEDLAELVNHQFYSGGIDALPWAGSFLGHDCLALDYLEDGTGLPDQITGLVESVDVEVARVLELVIEHATERAGESLMVVTMSEKHAVRVMDAVLARMGTNTALNEFVLGERSEAFMVLPASRAVAISRDQVIFSLGFGRTPHGRVLTDLGGLSEPDGQRLLAIAVTRARHSMRVVSCVGEQDLDITRLKHGSLAFAGLLSAIGQDMQDKPDDPASNPLLLDLARRLKARGLQVRVGYRGKLDLVAAYGGRCVAVDTDEVFSGRSLREALRLRPELLRRLGWHYARVHSFELFADPNGVADRIAEIVGAGSEKNVAEQ